MGYFRSAATNRAWGGSRASQAGLASLACPKAYSLFAVNHRRAFLLLVKQANENKCKTLENIKKIKWNIYTLQVCYQLSQTSEYTLNLSPRAQAGEVIPVRKSQQPRKAPFATSKCTKTNSGQTLINCPALANGMRLIPCKRCF